MSINSQREKEAKDHEIKHPLHMGPRPGTAPNPAHAHKSPGGKKGGYGDKARKPLDPHMSKPHPVAQGDFFGAYDTGDDGYASHVNNRRPHTQASGMSKSNSTTHLPEIKPNMMKKLDLRMDSDTPLGKKQKRGRNDEEEARMTSVDASGGDPDKPNKFLLAGQGMGMSGESAVAMGLLRIADFLSRKCLPWQAACCPRAVEQLRDIRMTIIQGKHADFVARMKKQLEDKVIQFLAKKDEEVDFWMQKEVSIWTDAMGKQEGDQTEFFQSDLQRITDRITAQEGSASHREVALAQALDEKERDNTRDQLIRFRKLCRNPDKMADADTRALHASFESAEGKVAANETIHARDIAKRIESAHEWLCCLADNALTAASSESILSGMFDTLEVEKDRAMKSMRSAMDTYTAQHNSILDAIIEFSTRIHRHAQDYLSREQLISRAFLQYLMSVISGEIKPHTNDVRRSSIAWEGKFTNDRAHRMDQNLNKEFNVVLMPFDKLVDDLRQRMVKQLEFVTIKMQGMLNGREQDINKRKADIHKKLALHVNKACNNRRKKLKNHSAHERNESALEEKSLGAINDTTMELRTAVDQIWIKEHMKERRMYEAAEGRMDRLKKSALVIWKKHSHLALAQKEEYDDWLKLYRRDRDETCADRRKEMDLSWLSWREDFGDRCKNFRSYMRPKFRMYLKRALDYDATVPIDTNIKDLKHLTGLVLTTFQTGVSNLRREMQTYIDKELKETDDFLKLRRDLLIQEWQDNLFRLNDAVNRRVSKLKDTEGDLEETLRLTMVQHEIESIVFEQSSCSRLENFWLNSREKIAAIGRDLKDTQAQMIALKGGEKKKTKNDRQIDAMMNMPDQKQTMKGAKQKGTNFKFDHTEKVEGVTFNNGCQFVDTFSMKRLLDEIRSDFYRNFVHKLVKIFEVVKKEHGVGKKRYLPAYLVSKVLFQMITEFWDVARFTDKCVGRFVYNGEVLFQDGLPLHARAIFVISTTITLMSEVSFVGNPNKCLMDVEHITDLIDKYQKKYFLVGLIMIVLKINSFGENFLKSEVMWACASCAIPPPAELFEGKQELFTGISTEDVHKQKDGGANATNEFMLQFHHTTGYHMEDPIDLYNSILQIGEVDWQDESLPHPRGTESVGEGVEEAKAPFNTKPKYMKEEPKFVDTEALFSAVGSVFPSVDLIILASLLGRPDNQFEVTTYRFCQAVAFWRRISIAMMVAGTDCPGAEYNRCDDLIQTHTISRDAKKRSGYANIACASPFEAVAAVLDWMTSIKSVPISVLQAFSIFVRGGSVDPWLEDPKQSRRGARFAYELAEFLEIFVKCKDYQSESEPIAATINEKVIDTLNQFDIQGSGVIPTEVLRSYTKKLDPDFSSTQVTACFWSLSRGRGVENDLVRLTEVMHTPPEYPAPVSVKDVGGPATEAIGSDAKYGDGDDEVKSVGNASDMGDQRALVRADDQSVISAIHDTEYAEGAGGEVEAYMEEDLKREANDNDGGLQAVALQVQANRAATGGGGASITGGDASVMGKSVAEGSTFGLDRYESTGVVTRPKPIDTVFRGDVPTYVNEFSKDVNAYLTAAPSLDANVILGYLPGALNPSAAHELLSDAMRLDPSAKNVIPASVCMWMGARLVGTNEAIRSITEPRKEATDLASKNAARIQSMSEKGQAAVNTELHLGVRTWTNEVDTLYEQAANPDEAKQYELSTYQRQLLHLLEMRMRIEIDLIIKYPQIVEQKNSDDHYGAAGGAPLDPKNHWNEVFDRRLARIDKLTLAWRDTMMSEWANSLYQSRTMRYAERSVVVHDCIAVYHDQYEELKHSIINERKELLLQYQKLDVELTDIIREDTGFMTYHGSFIDRLLRNVDGQMHRGLTIYEGALERYLKHCGAIKRRGLKRIEHANARLKEEMEKSCTGLIIGYTGGFAQGHFDELMYRGETWRKTVTEMHGDIIDEKEKFVHIKEESERDLAIQISDRITLDRARTKGLLDGLAEDTASIQEVVSNTRASYATIQKDANARLLIRIEKALRESRKLRAAAEESPDLETAVLREIRVVLNQAKTACDSIVDQIRDSSSAQLNNIEPLRGPHRAKMQEKIEGLENGWKEVEELLYPLINTFEKNIEYKIGVLKANCIEGIGEFREKETRDLAREHAKQRRTLVEAFREHFTTYNLGEAAIFENFNYEVKDTAIEIKSMWGPTRPGFLKQAMNDMSHLVMESTSRSCKDVYATAFDHHSCTDDSILLRAELSDIVTHSLVDMQQTFNTIADHFEAEKWKVVKEIESMKMDENGDIVKPQIGAVMDLLLSAIEIDVDFRKGYDGLIKASEDKSDEASIELNDFLNRFQNPDVAGSLPHAIKNLRSRIERRKEEVYSVIDAANKHVIADNTRMDVLLQAGFKDISEWETLTRQLVDNAFYNAEENYLSTVFNTPPASPRLDELPPDEDRVGRIKGLVRALHEPADLDHELDLEKTQRRNEKSRSRRSGKKDISSDILHKDDQIALKEIAENKPEKTKQLQQGWLECYSSEGYTYYYNPATRESLWDLPVALKVPLYDDDDVRVIETPRDIVAGEFYVQQEPDRMSTVKGIGDTTGSAQLKDRRLIMSELAESARAFAMGGLDTAVDVTSVLRGIKRDVNPFTKPSGRDKDTREREKEDDETLGNTTYVTSHGNETETEIDVNEGPPGAISTTNRQEMINSKPVLSETMILADEKAVEPGDDSLKHPYARTQESEQKMIDHADADTASVVSQSLTIQQGFLNDALGGFDDMSVQTEQDKALEAALVMEAMGVQPDEDDDTSVLLQEEETAAAKFLAEQAYHEARERDSMLSEMNRSMEVEDEFESMNKFTFNHKLVKILESKGVEQEQIDDLKAFSRKCKRITIIEELADHSMTWDKLQEMVFLTLAAKEEAKALEERLKTEQGRDRQKRILEHGEDVDEMAEFFKTDCKLSKTEARKCATECVLRKIFTAKKLAKFWFRNDINLEDDLGLDEDDAEDVAIQLRAIQAASTASIASLKSATSMLNSSSNVNLLSKHVSTPNLTQYQEDTQPEVWSYDKEQAQQQAQQQQEYYQGQLEAQQQQAAAAVAAASQQQYYDPNAVYYDEQGNPYHYDENGNAIYDEYGAEGQAGGDGSQEVYYDEQGNAYRYDENGNAVYDDNTAAQQDEYDPNAVYYDEQGNAYTVDEQGNAVYETDPAITRAQSSSHRTLDPKKSWSEHKTEEGYNYYYNEVTGSSAWELPVGEALQDANNDEGSVASQSSFVNFSLYGPTKNRLLPIPTLPEVSVYSRDEGVQRQLTLLGLQDRWQNLLVKTQFFFTEKRAEFNKQREDNFNQVTNRLEQRLGLFVDDIKYMQRNLRKEMTDLNASERDLRRLFDEENPNVIKAEKLSFVLSGIEKMKTKAGSRYEAATKQIEKCQNDWALIETELLQMGNIYDESVGGDLDQCRLACEHNAKLFAYDQAQNTLRVKQDELKALRKALRHVFMHSPESTIEAETARENNRQRQRDQLVKRKNKRKQLEKDLADYPDTIEMELQELGLSDIAPENMIREEEEICMSFILTQVEMEATLANDYDRYVFLTQ